MHNVHRYSRIVSFPSSELKNGRAWRRMGSSTSEKIWNHYKSWKYINFLYLKRSKFLGKSIITQICFLFWKKSKKNPIKSVLCLLRFFISLSAIQVLFIFGIFLGGGFFQNTILPLGVKFAPRDELSPLEGLHLWGITSPLGANFTSRGKLHP
jgi:hypothetical protein